MGAAESSPELSEAALQRSGALDTEVLQYSENDLSDIAWLQLAYTQGIQTGVLSTTQSTQYLLRKQQQLPRKLRDTNTALAASFLLPQPPAQPAPATPPTATSHPTTHPPSHTHTDYQRKQLKYLQRTVTTLSSPADPYGDIGRARAALVERVQVAYVRMRRRQEGGAGAGKACRATREEKRGFVLALLRGDEEEYLKQWLDGYEEEETVLRRREEEEARQAKREASERAIERAREQIRQRMVHIRAQLDVWNRQSGSGVPGAVPVGNNSGLMSSHTSHSARLFFPPPPSFLSTHPLFAGNSPPPVPAAGGGSAQPAALMPPVSSSSSSASSSTSSSSTTSSSSSASPSEPAAPAVHINTAAANEEKVTEPLSPSRSPTTSFSSLNTPSIPSPALSSLSSPASPTLSSSSLISEQDEKKQLTSLDDTAASATATTAASSPTAVEQKQPEAKPSSSIPQLDESFVEAVLAELDRIPELLGVTGLLGLLHPRERQQHIEQLIQRRWLETQGGRRGDGGRVDAAHLAHMQHLLSRRGGGTTAADRGMGIAPPRPTDEARGVPMDDVEDDGNDDEEDEEDENAAEMEVRNPSVSLSAGTRDQGSDAPMQQILSSFIRATDNVRSLQQQMGGAVDVLPHLLRNLDIELSGAHSENAPILQQQPQHDDEDDDEDEDDEDREEDEEEDDVPLVHERQREDDEQAHQYGSVPDSHDEEEEEEGQEEEAEEQEEDDVDALAHDFEAQAPNAFRFGGRRGEMMAPAGRGGRGRGGRRGAGRGGRGGGGDDDLDAAIEQSLQAVFTSASRSAPRQAESTPAASAASSSEVPTAPQPPEAGPASAPITIPSVSTSTASAAPLPSSAFSLPASSSSSAASSSSAMAAQLDAELAAAMAGDVYAGVMNDPELMEAIALSLRMDREAAQAASESQTQPATVSSTAAASSSSSSSPPASGPASDTVTAADTASAAAVENEDGEVDDEELQLARALSITLANNPDSGDSTAAASSTRDDSASVGSSTSASSSSSTSPADFTSAVGTNSALMSSTTEALVSSSSASASSSAAPSLSSATSATPASTSGSSSTGPSSSSASAAGAPAASAALAAATGAPAYNVDLDAELAASLLNDEDAELAQAIALSLQMSRESTTAAPATAASAAPATNAASASTSSAASSSSSASVAATSSASSSTAATTFTASRPALPSNPTTSTSASTSSSSALSSPPRLPTLPFQPSPSTAAASSATTSSSNPSAPGSAASSSASISSISRSLTSQLDRLQSLLTGNQLLIAQLARHGGSSSNTTETASPAANASAATSVASPQRPNNLLELVQQRYSQPAASGDSASPSPSSSSSSSSTSSAGASSSASSSTVPSSFQIHEEELTNYLTSLTAIRQQLRARRVEERQAALATGLLSQRQEEQQLMAMVEELTDNIRVLRDQCRRLQDETAPPTAAAPATANPSQRPSAAEYVSQMEAAGLTVRPGMGGAAGASGMRRATAEKLPLDDNDINFNTNNLLHTLLTHASKRSLDLIDTAASSAPVTSAAGRCPAPSVKFLVLIQRDLYRKAALAAKPSDAIIGQFVQYVKRLLVECGAVMARVVYHKDTWKDATLDSALSESVWAGLVGAALPITLTVLNCLLFRPLFSAAAPAIFSPLQQLLTALNTAALLYPSNGTIDRMDSQRPPMSADNVRVVESPHSYLPSCEDEQRVIVPGADYLSLEFDHRCSTERGRDVLDVLNEEQGLVASLDGDNGAWPLTPLMVPGSSVLLRFHAESANPTMRFGYRIVVRGMQFPTPPPAVKVTAPAAPAAAATSGQTVSGDGVTTNGPTSASGTPAAATQTSATSATAPAVAQPSTAASAPRAVPAAATSNSAAATSGSKAITKSDLLAEVERSRLPSPSKDPTVLLHTVPFIFDLLNSAARVFGKAARLLIVGEPTSVEHNEKAHSKWLSSPLFSQGFESDHPAAEAAVTVATLVEPKPATAEVEPVKVGDRVATANNINASSNVDSTTTTLPTTPTSSTPTIDADTPPLDPTLSIGSGLDAVFLAQFIDCTADTAGGKFDALMRRQVRASGAELMGGAVVKRTVRCFVAALLKHLGLVGAARQYVKDSEVQSKVPPTLSSVSSQLVDVWKKGSLMHRWIISQRQSMQQLHLAKLQQLEGEGKSLSPEQLSAAERRLEYEGFCAPLFNKALYLLSVRPCLTQPVAPRSSHLASTPGLSLASEVSSTLALSRTLSNEVQLVRSASSGGRARDSAESFLSLFSVYKTLQHFNQYKAKKEGEAAEGGKGDDNIVDLLALFVQADTPVHKFTRLIAAQSKRAQQRLTAIETVLALLSSTSFNTARLGLLAQLSNPFRACNAYPAGSEEEGAPVGLHYYSKIESCDFRLRKRVRTAFLSLYRLLASYIKDEKAALSLRALALNLWAIEWIPLDHSELLDMDMLHTLHQIAQHGQYPVLKQSAAAVLQLMVASQVRFDSNLPTVHAGTHVEAAEEGDSEEEDDDSMQGVPSVPPSNPSHINNHKPFIHLDRLQQQIVDHVFTDLYHSFHSLAKLKLQVAAFQLSDTQLEQKPRSAVTAASYLSAEAAAFASLSTLISMAASSTSVLSYIGSRNVVQLLLIVLSQGSPRLQRAALSLLGELLGCIAPLEWDKMRLSTEIVPQGKSAPQATATAFVRYLFGTIGLLSYGDYARFVVHTSPPYVNPYDNRSGDVHLSLAAAMIMFIRQRLNDAQQARDAAQEAEREDEEKQKQAEDREEKRPDNTTQSWADEITAVMSEALARLPSLASNPASSAFRLDSTSPDSFPLSSAATYPSFLLLIAAISLLGGYADRIRVGGKVQTVSSSSSSAARKETGTVVSLDRSAGRVKVLFDHTPHKVIETDLSKLRSSTSVAADSSPLLRHEGAMQAFATFVRELQEENRKVLIRKQGKMREMAERDRKEKEDGDAARRRAKEEAEAPLMLEDAAWLCDVCTFVNPSSLKPFCEMCSAPNAVVAALTQRTPKSLVPATPKKTPRSVLLEGAEKEEEERTVEATTADALLYHTLRSRTLRALCHLLQNSPSSIFLSHAQLLPNLLSLATRPTQLEGFSSIPGLEQREERLLELLLDKSAGLVNDQQRFADRAKGTQLSHSPFKSLTVLLPNSFDLGAPRSISFLTDDCSTVQYTRGRDSAVAVLRSNHLVPNSLPAYYFEVTLLDAGQPRTTDPSAFHLAIGLARSGMPLKGYPGTNSSYALSAKGELCSSGGGGRVVRQSFGGGSGFVAGDVIGCLWNLRKNTIQFSVNGRLLDANGSSSASPSSGKQEAASAFAAVNGRFYPACWCEADNMQLRANWGQEPFKFDFLSTLPPGYLNSLSAESADVEVTHRPRTAAEIKRRTQAEELSLICSFPIELCEIALEQKNDDMERAVHFLLESGNQELQRMADEAIRQSQMMEEERKTRVLGVTDVRDDEREDSDDEEALADWLSVAPSPSHQEQPVGGGRGGWGGVWGSGNAGGMMQQMAASMAGGGGNANLNRRAPSSSPASMLDDEIEQDVPVGVELPTNQRQQAQAHPLSREEAAAAGGRRAAGTGGGAGDVVIQEQVKIDDISCGHALTVSEHATHIVMEDELALADALSTASSAAVSSDHFLPLSRFVGRTGIVAAVNVNQRCVQLLLFDSDLSAKHCRWFPVSTLCKPQRMWVDPCQELVSQSWRHVAHAYIANEQALSVRKVRTSILKLFGSWPSSIPFTLQQLGGAAAVIDMLKLSASELLSTHLTRRDASTNGSSSHQLLQTFQSKLSLLIDREVELFAADPSSLPAVRIDESLYGTKDQAADKDRLDRILSSNTAHSQYLLPRLVEETIVHFIQAVNHPTPTLTIKSPHPYPSHSDVRERLYIPGASKLLITFDPACAISEDMLTRLTFYRDSQYQDAVMVCSGRYGSGYSRWQSFVVTGDRLYYKFTSGSNTEHWGYKFKVQPLELRINDEKALQGLNLELGSWLFELFLTTTPSFVVRHYAVDLYNSIVWYVIHAKPSAKSRGVELLVRFLLHMHQLDEVDEDEAGAKAVKVATRSLDFSKLQPLQAQMNQVLDSMNESDYRGGLSSPALQGLIELLATTDLVKAKSASSREKEWLEEDSKLQLIKGDSYEVKDGSSSTITDGDELVDVSQLAVYKLHIIRASYGLLSQGSGVLDVTDTLAKYVEECGGSQLYIPFASALLHQLFVDPAPRKEKKLQLRYAIQRSVYSHEHNRIETHTVKEVDKTIPIPTNPYSRGSNPQAPGVLIRPVPSPFDSVVELSRFTLQMQQRGQFAADVMQEVVRADAVSKTFYPLIGTDGVHFDEKTRKGVVDASGAMGSQFTLMFWIYIPDAAAAAAATIGEAATDSSAAISSSSSSSASSTTPPTGSPVLLSPSSSASSSASSSSSSSSASAASSSSASSSSSSSSPPSTARRMAASSHRDARQAPTTATSSSPLRCIVQKGNYNAELALSGSQSSHWSHAASHLNYSGFNLTLGPGADHRLTFSLYTFHQPPQQTVSNHPLPTNRWVHVAVIVNKHSCRLLVDGTEEGQRRLQGYRRLTADPWFWGCLPVGGMDLSDEKWQGGARGPGMEDESRRVGVTATIKDARFVGFAMEVREVGQYVRGVTRYNPQFTARDINTTLQPVWKDKKELKKGSKDDAEAAATSTLTSTTSSTPATAVPAGDRKEEAAAKDKESAISPPPLSPAPSTLFSPGPRCTLSFIRRETLHRTPIRFTAAMDSQLIEYVTAGIEAEQNKQRATQHPRDAPPPDFSTSLLELQPYSAAFPLDQRSIQSYHLINQVPFARLRSRFVAIQTINAKLSSVLPLVDFSQAGSSWSLAHRLSSMSWLILREVKTRAWASILRQTGNQGTTTWITVNRPRALRAREKGDMSGMKSVFGQIYRQLHFIRPSLLRTDQRPWRVTFEGEGGTDAGGLFRDSVSHICSELQTPAIPLFIPCPNSKTKIGDNQDKFIPNPSATSSIHLSMYAFVGKLMGIAIRGGHMLNLDFPSLVFRPLVGQPITRADLQAVDALSFDVLDKIGAMPEAEADSFTSTFALTFTTMASDGQEVELVPGGREQTVTWHNRLEYCQLVEQYRLTELSQQIAAIRKGLGTIVPIQLLPLFTAVELECMICGKREISIDYLRANTRYRPPITAHDRHVQMMWEVLASFSHEERQLFIRFVWGQSRLPYNPADFTQKFEIWPHPRDDDRVLPVSHTCFFSIELPRYSGVEVMRSKILYAINNGYAIDTDHVADALDWNAD